MSAGDGHGASHPLRIRSASAPHPLRGCLPMTAGGCSFPGDGHGAA
nr:MAG TPA: hypothetical protein [Podoviridae sp. ctAV815]